MRFEYLLIVLGVALSFVAAVLPHFSGAFRLHFDILLMQLIPYLVYAPAVARTGRTLAIGAGLLLVLAHGALVIHQRILEGGEYAGPVIYLVPLALAVLLLPLFLRATRPPWKA